MKRRRFKPQLSEQQQLILGLVLVVLLAISMLYCLGFASLALRQAWENAPLPWNATDSPGEVLDLTAPPATEPVDTGPAPH